MASIKKITAEKGKVFKRIHDGFIMSDEIYLGYDFSTGKKRQDKAEYYEQIEMIVEPENDIE